MRVGLCTRNSRNPVIKLLEKTLSAEGHQVEILTDPRRLVNPAGFGAAFWRPDSRDWGVALFSRQVPMILEGLGVPFVNSLASCDRAFNKLVTSVLFAEAGVPTPDVQLMPQHWDAEETSEQLSGAVIAKPIEGKAGEGVELFPTAEAALRQLRGVADTYLLQLPIDWTQSFRLIVTSQGVVRGFLQDNPTGHAEPTITHIGGNWPSPAKEIPEDAESLAVTMLNAVGGDFMRADLLRDASGKLWGLEINSSFGFPHSDPVLLKEFTNQFRLAARGSVR